MFQKATVFVALCCGFATSLCSQQVTTSVDINGRGQSILHIHNTSDHAITAIVFTAELQTIRDQTNSEIYRYLDSLTGGWHAVRPHSDGNVIVVDSGARALVTFRAAMLDDNTVSGDPAWGARIPQYRQIWKDSILDLLSQIDGATANHAPLQDLIAQCQAAAALANSQKITGSDWNAEALRYRRRVAQGFHKMAAGQLGRAVDAGTPPAEALATLSASLRANLR